MKVRNTRRSNKQFEAKYQKKIIDNFNVINHTNNFEDVALDFKLAIVEGLEEGSTNEVGSGITVRNRRIIATTTSSIEFKDGDKITIPNIDYVGTIQSIGRDFYDGYNRSRLCADIREIKLVIQ